jgi:hypothetical protein
MNSVLLISGLVLIVVGWLCYRFPNMINPYGGMTPERKALVDIVGLKKSLFITWAVTGVLLIVSAVLSYKKILDEDNSGLLMTGLLLASLIPTFIAMKKYNGFGRDKSGRAAPFFSRPTKWVWVSMGLTAVFVIAVFAFSNQAPKIEVNENTISISGMYGRDILTSEIVSVELLEKLPPIRQRTNGSSTHKYNKGHFLLKNGEKCIMIVLLNAPYIEIRTTDNLYYLNGATKDETEALYQQIKQLKP